MNTRIIIHIISCNIDIKKSMIDIIGKRSAKPRPSLPRPSSASLGLTKSIMSFYSTQIVKSNLFQEDLSTFGEPLRSGLLILRSPIPVGQS